MIIYLATPYSHLDPAVRQERFELACAVAAELMRKGHSVFSPIAHSHNVADWLPEELLLDHEFWMRQDLPLLTKADALWVFTAPGWQESRGVAREILEAHKLGIPVNYLTPRELGMEEGA